MKKNLLFVKLIRARSTFFQILKNLLASLAYRSQLKQGHIENLLMIKMSKRVYILKFELKKLHSSYCWKYWKWILHLYLKILLLLYWRPQVIWGRQSTGPVISWVAHPCPRKPISNTFKFWTFLNNCQSKICFQIYFQSLNVV